MYQQITILKLTAPTAMIAATHAYELKPEFITTTPNPAVAQHLSRIINNMLADDYHIDMAYLTIMIIIIGSSIIMFIGIKQPLGRYSYLYIELCQARNVCNSVLQLCQMPRVTT